MTREKIRIRSIVAAPLFGESPKGGWSTEIRPEDSVHALIAVHTDAGITGYGSVFTDGGLVEAGARGAGAALCRRERAGARARHREAAPEHLLDGPRRHAHPHHQRHRHRAVGHPRQGTGQPVGRLLGGSYRKRVQPYCSLLMEEPRAHARRLAPYRGARASAPSRSAGGRSAARGDARLDEAIVRAAREAVGDESQLLVDAGASDAYWPHGLKWAMRTARC